MTHRQNTPIEVLKQLLEMSYKLKTGLTPEMVRETIGVDGTAGIKRFELLIPELVFTKRYYNGAPYIKITPNKTKLKLKLERV